MVRYAFINNQILSIYRRLPEIKFPLDLESVLHQFPNCRYMSYQEFAELNHCTLDEVISICESKSGCTHYEVSKDRYLIMCNESQEHYNNQGRQRWTMAHEIGHIVCNHHSIAIASEYEKIAENGLKSNPDFEAESDYFSGTLLAPFPFFQSLGISSEQDIQKVCGLSCQAAFIRYEKYVKWKRSHKKTSWENDMLRLLEPPY